MLAKFNEFVDHIVFPEFHEFVTGESGFPVINRYLSPCPYRNKSVASLQFRDGFGWGRQTVKVR